MTSIACKTGVGVGTAQAYGSCNFEGSSLSISACAGDVIDDDWREDGSDASELNREWKARENEFHKMGYRDGVIAGKEASAQEGFDVGYKQAVIAAYNLGIVRGATGALARLSAGVKDKLASATQSKDRLGRLHESVESISTADALRLFQEDMLFKGEKPHSRPEENSRPEVSIDETAGGFCRLGNYFRELESLTSEFPGMIFHWEEEPCVYRE